MMEFQKAFLLVYTFFPLHYEVADDLIYNIAIYAEDSSPGISQKCAKARKF